MIRRGNGTRIRADGALVFGFAFAIPFVEVALGAMIFFGAGLRFALPAGTAYMMVLMVGTLVRADYSTVTKQLVYSAIFAALVAGRTFDRWSFDASRGGRTALR